MNAPELPILDGSAIEYATKIDEVGIEEQNEDKNFYIVKQKLEVVDEETGASIVVLPFDSFRIDVMIEFKSPITSLHRLAAFHVSRRILPQAAHLCSCVKSSRL